MSTETRVLAFVMSILVSCLAAIIFYETFSPDDYTTFRHVEGVGKWVCLNEKLEWYGEYQVYCTKVK